MKFSESCDHAAHFWTTYFFILTVQRGKVYSSAVVVCVEHLQMLALVYGLYKIQTLQNNGSENRR